MTTRLFFGGLIAIVLLIFYAIATVYGTTVAYCIGHGGCSTTYSPNLTEGVVTVLNLVGGLVSALVISQLAVTQPLAPPGAGLVDDNASPTVKNGVKIISIMYVVVWVACGMAVLIVGLMLYPAAVPLLNAAAKAWLGLAVAAGYSYLGLKPANA